MTDKPRRGLAHLVGSMPMDSADAVFRKIAGTLSDCLCRMPDGETGARRRWIYWQREMLESHPAMEVDSAAGMVELRQWDGTLLREQTMLRLKPEVDANGVSFETGYAEAALESWPIFARLKQDGLIAPDMLFQVCLPTPMSIGCMYVSPREHERFLPAYERALMTALAEILERVPHDQISIQWDICQEVLVFEDYFPARPADYKERVFGLLGRLGQAVPGDVDLGYHLCYGSPADQHLVMPKDTAIMAELMAAIFARAGRRIDFVHLPVPKDRTDKAYFAALSGLAVPPATQIYLGLIHHDDEAGDRARIDAGHSVLKNFGIATECGLARGNPAWLDDYMRSHERAVDYLLAGA